MEHILIIEDDIHINAILTEALTKAGYSCVSAYSGTEGKLLLERSAFDLVLLDLMLPGMSGEELLADIRRKSDLPVMVLTAKDSLDDKIDLLISGADDYITKPFEIKEVLARIQVQLRHQNGQPQGTIVSWGDMVLDRQTFSVAISGVELPQLTKQEFDILELLLRNPGRVFSKEDIFEYAWQEPYMGETKTLDVHISNIRKKIKMITEKEYIETVWGIGYKLASN